MVRRAKGMRSTVGARQRGAASQPCRRTSPAKCWSGFVRSENFKLIALAAHKFGCRPSDLVVIQDPVLALDFDLAATVRLLAIERRAMASELNPDESSSGGSYANEVYW